MGSESRHSKLATEVANISGMSTIHAEVILDHIFKSPLEKIKHVSVLPDVGEIRLVTDKVTTPGKPEFHFKTVVELLNKDVPTKFTVLRPVKTVSVRPDPKYKIVYYSGLEGNDDTGVRRLKTTLPGGKGTNIFLSGLEGDEDTPVRRKGRP